MSLCLDYNESDHIIITSYNISIAKTRPFKLSLFGKMSIDNDRCSVEHAKFLSDVWFYKLEDDVCYVLNDQNVLWCFAWNGKVWSDNFRARFYNEVSCVLSMHVHRDEVYLLVNTGHILLSEVNSMCFNIVAHLPFDMTEMSPCPVMFGRYSVVCGVPRNESAETKFFNYADNFLIIWPALSCATQHGHVLFLGFETGQVQICIYHPPQGKDKPYTLERNFNIRQYDKQTDDLKIIALNVYELKNRQYLFIRTRNCIYQVLLSYLNVEVF